MFRVSGGTNQRFIKTFLFAKLFALFEPNNPVILQIIHYLREKLSVQQSLLEFSAFVL